MSWWAIGIVNYFATSMTFQVPKNWKSIICRMRFDSAVYQPKILYIHRWVRLPLTTHHTILTYRVNCFACISNVNEWIMNENANCIAITVIKRNRNRTNLFSIGPHAMQRKSTEYNRSLSLNIHHHRFECYTFTIHGYYRLNLWWFRANFNNTFQFPYVFLFLFHSLIQPWAINSIPFNDDINF